MPNKTKQNTKKQYRTNMLATTIQITNNPPHTTHTQKKTPPGQLRGQPPPTTGSRRQHGVEREPDSVLICYQTFHTQPKNAPTPTTHTQGSKHMQAQENNHTPTQQSQRTLAPHKTGLPRKEVIQPHLPVRLPCYDFVPIANPTFDHSPRKNG